MPTYHLKDYWKILLEERKPCGLHFWPPINHPTAAWVIHISLPSFPNAWIVGFNLVDRLVGWMYVLFVYILGCGGFVFATSPHLCASQTPLHSNAALTILTEKSFYEKHPSSGFFYKFLQFPLTWIHMQARQMDEGDSIARWLPVKTQTCPGSNLNSTTN